MRRSRGAFFLVRAQVASSVEHCAPCFEAVAIKAGHGHAHTHTCTAPVDTQRLHSTYAGLPRPWGQAHWSESKSPQHPAWRGTLSTQCSAPCRVLGAFFLALAAGTATLCTTPPRGGRIKPGFIAPDAYNLGRYPTNVGELCPGGQIGVTGLTRAPKGHICMTLVSASAMGCHRPGQSRPWCSALAMGSLR